MTTLLQEIEAGVLDLDATSPERFRFTVLVNGDEFGAAKVLSSGPNAIEIVQSIIVTSFPPDTSPDLRQFDGQAVNIDIEERDIFDAVIGMAEVSGVARITTRPIPERGLLQITMSVGPGEDR